MLSPELRSQVKYVDVLVIGAGPAGMAAAIAAKEAGVDNLLVLEREQNMGGILRQCIHNGFGLHRFKEELTGPEYAQRDIDKVKELGIEVRTGTTVLSIDENRFVTAISREKGVQLFEAGAVILAMGCRERPRGALATPGTRCAGVYSAGTAQKFVNLEGYMPGKRCVILGSGDIGLIMARRMTLQGAKVLACVELMPYSSGLNRNIVQCLVDHDIPLKFNHTVTQSHGRERVTGVTVSEVDPATRAPIAG
ncbi:MAG: FAD-dependent oxidoreductase, partial [Clostridia bacterium]|nr:FAD-dependent oxidoreductase [Clostridia bacterium]